MLPRTGPAIPSPERHASAETEARNAEARSQDRGAEAGAAEQRDEVAQRIADLDARATRLAHGVAATRLALGEAVEVLAARGAHHELGFSSVSAYVVERCNRSARWVADAQALARQLSALGGVREQLLSGELSWSRAELVAKLIEHGLAQQQLSNQASAPTLRRAVEVFWLHLTRTKTCLELRNMLGSLQHGSAAQEFTRSLCLTLSADDALLFRAAELLFRRLEGRVCLDAFLECLLAETGNTLIHPPPDPREQAEPTRRDRWRAQLARWRERAEQLCEARRPELPPPRTCTPQLLDPGELVAASAEQLDRHIVALANQLGSRDLELGRLAEVLHRAKAWRHLGFASEHHYARERLGLSMSSLKARRALARRLQKLPGLAQALEQAQIGSVAACLVARVASPVTLARWIERARQRTVKHLSEEIGFVERVLRERPGHTGWPPDPGTMRAALGLQGEMASGRYFLQPNRERLDAYQEQIRRYEQARSEPAPTRGPTPPAVGSNEHGQTSGGETNDSGGAQRGPRPIGDGLGLGRVRLRLRLREGTLRLYRDVERAFRRKYPTKPLLRSLCEHFIDVWAPALRRERKYEDIYARDGYVCSSPVCRRHDVTPHHLRFRSQGGDDSPENLIALCVWCHLEGIHGGRLKARPGDAGIHWTIGRRAILQVIDRDKLAA